MDQLFTTSDCIFFNYYYYCFRLDTVQEVLRQVKAKAESLGLESTDLVFDHAIYAKAVEVLTNPANKDLQSFINLRMGRSHACCIYLAELVKRFGSPGIREIIVEADLTGPGSAEAVLKGKNYNRALRVMKTVYEALMRLKVEAFENWMHANRKYDVAAEFLESREISELLTKRTQINVQRVRSCLSHIFEKN